MYYLPTSPRCVVFGCCCYGVFVAVGAAHPTVIGIVVQACAFGIDVDVLPERHRLTYKVESTCANMILFYA